LKIEICILKIELSIFILFLNKIVSFFLIDFFDHVVNKAYQFSSITSVTLLDCWTVAWVIALTWFFLGTRYTLWQLLGAAICVLGLGLVLLSDAGVGGGGDIYFLV
jgi:drug/metabolite transporter (DMT)-like permease